MKFLLFLDISFPTISSENALPLVIGKVATFQCRVETDLEIALAFECLNKKDSKERRENETKVLTAVSSVVMASHNNSDCICRLKYRKFTLNQSQSIQVACKNYKVN